MELMFPLLLFLIASNTLPTWATNAKTGDFKGMVCNKCQEWCVRAPSISSCDDADSAGVFELNIPEVGVKDVFCDVADDGRKWTVFQRRMYGNEDFNRRWDDYVIGFGDLQGDHWLGLEAMYQMTKDENMELEIKVITKTGVYWVIKYSHFHIGPGSDNYRLHLDGLSGNATDDGLMVSEYMQFTTYDADHDSYPDGNCASYCEGGWWYDGTWFCAQTNLNGNYQKTGVKAFRWWIDEPLRFSQMKIRERS